MVIAHIMPMTVSEHGASETVSANLALLRIGADGKLDYVRKYDIEVGASQMFWMGMVQR